MAVEDVAADLKDTLAGVPAWGRMGEEYVVAVADVDDGQGG